MPTSTSSSPLPPLPDPQAAVEASSSDTGSSNASWWRRGLIFVCTLGVGIVSGVLISRNALGEVGLGEWTLAQAIFAALGMLIGTWLIIAVHELGHTVAGYLAGFRLQHISVGPLKLQRTPDGWKASRSQHGVFVGMSHSVPGPDLQEASQDAVRRARAVRLAGGAAANVFTGLLALGLAWALPEGREMVGAVLMTFGILSLATGVVNLIPFRTGSGLVTDGARLLPLLRGTPEAGRDVALAAVRAEAYDGTRPGDWSPRWVERMLTPRDHGVTDGSTRMLAYRHALDAGRTEDAGTHLGEALTLLDRLPRAQHAGLMVEAAYYEAAHRGDPDRARAWLQRATNGSGTSPQGVPTCAAGRAEAATLLAEGNDDEARQQILGAESALGEHPVPGTAVAEQAWLRDLAGRASVAG